MLIPDSPVRKALLKGELQAAFQVEIKLLSDAKTGNQMSARLFSALVRDRSFRLTKADLFGGSEDRTLFEDIQRLIETGSSENFSDNEQLYIQALEMVYSFMTRFGDRKTLRLLLKAPFNLSHERARDMMGEALELFNGGRRNTKQAMRYHTAECYDTIYHAIIATAKTPQDLAIAAGVLDKKARLLGLNEPDKETLKPENYPRKFIVSSLAPEAIGLTPANRDALGAQIDALSLPAEESDRLKRDAGVKDFDILKALDHADTEEN